MVRALLTGAATYARPWISAVTGMSDALSPALVSAPTDLQIHISTVLLSYRPGNHAFLALLSTLQPALPPYLLYELSTLHLPIPRGSTLDVIDLVCEDGSKAMSRLFAFADQHLLSLKNDATFEGGIHADYQ